MGERTRFPLAATKVEPCLGPIVQLSSGPTSPKAVNRCPTDESMRKMITNDEKALLVLNRLIRANRDAELGFMAAADGVPGPELVQLFAGYGLERAKYVVEL